MQDQAARLRRILLDKSHETEGSRDENAKRARVITITSGKGGVGKTSLAVNLTLALQRLGQKVILIDADFGMANIDVLLGCATKYNIADLIDGTCSIDKIISHGPYDINFVAGGSGICSLANLSSFQLQKISVQFSKLDNLADIILVDTGAGLNENVMSFVMAADEVVLVTTPEPTAITDAYAILKAYCAYHGQRPVKLLVNKVINDQEGFDVVDKLTHVAYRFLDIGLISLGYIYEDRKVSEAVRRQQPLLVAYSESPTAKCIENVARKLLFHQIIPGDGGMKGFFRKILRKI